MAELTECLPSVVTKIEDCAEKDGPVTAIPIYKKKVDKDTLIREHPVIATNDVEKTKEVWRDQVNLNERHDKYCSVFEEMMSKYAQCGKAF